MITNPTLAIAEDGSFRQLIEWCKIAQRSQWLVYHSGSLAIDRTKDEDVSNKANLVLLLTETGFLTTNQFKPQVDQPTNYIAVRTGGGYAPRSLLAEEISTTDWRVLQSIRNARFGKSITRVIRDTVSVQSEDTAKSILKDLIEREFIEEDRSVSGWKITLNGLKALN